MSTTEEKLINVAGLTTFLAKMRVEIVNTISTAINNIGNATSTLRGFMSNTDKVKLDNIAENAQVNVIESITINGVAQTVTNKAVALAIPSGTAYSESQPTTGEDYWDQPY